MTRRQPLLFAAALVAALAAGCDRMMTFPLYGSVEVDVQQPNGQPIGNVPLTLYTGFRPMGYASTDANGHYRFTSVPTGSYAVQVVRPEGYRSFITENDSLEAVQDDVGVTVGSDIPVKFVLPQCTGTIQALAADSSGAPIAGVEMELYQFDSVIQTLTTGADGIAAFSGPCVEPLGVRVDDGPGYTVVPGRGSQYVDGLSVGSGQTLTVTFVLRRP